MIAIRLLQRRKIVFVKVEKINYDQRRILWFIGEIILIELNRSMHTDNFIETSI